MRIYLQFNLLLVALIASSGCGLATAPVSLPAAIARNTDITLRGVVMDDEGKPLDEVLVDVDRFYMTWRPLGGEQCESKQEILLVSREFEMKLHGYAFGLNFHKRGYGARQIKYSQGSFLQWDRDRRPSAGPMEVRMLWPGDTERARIVLPRFDRELPPLRYLDAPLAPGLVVVDVAALAAGAYRPVSELSGPITQLAAGMLGVQVGPRPALSRERDDSVDLDPPEWITLRIGGTDGFLQYAPLLGCGPLEQMTEAPLAGYVNEISLTSAELRRMHDSYAKERNVPVERGIRYWYFRSNGKYGKIAIGWYPVGHPHPRNLYLSVQIQPSGSRDLHGW